MRQKSGLVKHSVSVGELRSAMLPPGGSSSALTHKGEGVPEKQTAGEEGRREGPTTQRRGAGDVGRGRAGKEDRQKMNECLAEREREFAKGITERMDGWREKFRDAEEGMGDEESNWVEEQGSGEWSKRKGRKEKEKEGIGENGGRCGAAGTGSELREKQVVAELPLFLREVWRGRLRLGRRS